MSKSNFLKKIKLTRPFFVPIQQSMSLMKTLFKTSNFRNITSTTLIFLRKMSSTPDDVLFQDFGDKGIITLNRPKALNSLDLSMVSKLHPKLALWQNEKSLIIIKGSGGKAFCAGGDVKSVAQAGMSGNTKYGQEFFKTEYRTDGLVGSLKMPYVALIDGIVMGGGVGLSVHGSYRVATERSLFAMPETQIGLFPDVGGSYFLPRLKGKLGLFLALTGYRLRGADVWKAGIATHCVDSKNLEPLENDLLKCKDVKEVESTLSRYNVKDNGPFSLEPHIGLINECFGAPSVEEIVSRLEKNDSNFAKETVALLAKMSPTSLKITMKQLQRGAKMNLEECLQMEYRLAVGCLTNKDFYEGVRALLIDKDQKPKWNPSTLAEVSSELVDKHFARLPEDQELRHKL